MRSYSTTPVQDNLSARPRRPRASWSIQRRLRFTWRGNHRHVEAAPCSKRRWRREDATGRALLELPAIVAGVARLAVRTGDARAHQVVEQLQLVTAEGLGLVRYRRRPGERRAGREGWYIPAARDVDVSAFLALAREAYQLVASWGRTFYRETRRMVAGLARAMRRDLSTVNPGVSPHPTIGVVSLARDNSCSSDAPRPSWLREVEQRRCQLGGEERA